MQSAYQLALGQKTDSHQGIFMEHSRSNKSEIHYHIRWSNSLLDWKPFPKKEEAIELAGGIRKPNESYSRPFRYAIQLPEQLRFRLCSIVMAWSSLSAGAAIGLKGRRQEPVSGTINAIVIR
jgi:hypothetical protein